MSVDRRWEPGAGNPLAGFCPGGGPKGPSLPGSPSLWGDTVNTASRMESSGSPGEIQVTREVFDRLQGQFELEPRGLIQVKGKGEMETFLLKGELPSEGATRQAG